VRFARASAGSLVALVFGVAVSIVLPRLLGPEARGEYQLAVKVAALVLAVAQWGIPEVLLQFVAEGRAPQGALVGTSMVLGVMGAASVAIVLLLAQPLFAGNLLRDVAPSLLWLTLGGSIISLVGLLARRFIQLGGRLDLYNGLDIGRTLLFLLLVVLGGAATPRDARVPTLAWLLAEIALAASAGLYLWRRLLHARGLRIEPTLARSLATAGAPIQIGLLGMFVGSEGGAFVLNANLDLRSVGIYAVALAVARLVLQISIALRTALQPRLIGPERDSADVTTRVTRHALLWMLAVAAGLACGSPLIPVVFGAEFAPAAPALLAVLPGMVAYGVWQLLAGHLLRIGRRGLLAVIAWLFGLTSVALQAMGSATLGVIGATLGLSLAYLLASAVVLVAFVRLSGHSARDLLPAPGDLAFYAGLTRRVLATR
jgi:O-antigen/teichoic acid export membrane protein